MSAPRPRPDGTPGGAQVLTLIATLLMALLLIGLLLKQAGLG